VGIYLLALLAVLEKASILFADKYVG
jgi:hypothetical protein